MSATGHPVTLSAHAEYRREDYVFARTQSRRSRELEWDSRLAPLQSWSDMVYPALGLASAAVAMFEILH